MQSLEQDKYIEELENDNKFLKKLVRLLHKGDAYDASIHFRVPKKTYPYVINVKCDETTEYMDYEDIISNSNQHYANKIYNYKEYSNLPQNCVLHTLENVVHNGTLTYIYGYLDKETKTFIKHEYDLTKIDEE